MLHADETHWLLMQKGGSKKWYVWALATEDAVYYHLNPSRGQDIARTLLDGYTGVAMADGYAAYQALLKRPGHTPPGALHGARDGNLSKRCPHIRRARAHST